MSVNNLDMSVLSIEEEVEVETIYVSLMSKLRVEYDTISAMELDDEINDDLQIESGMELFEEEIPETEEEKERTTKNAEVGFLKKKEIKSKKVYRDYSDLQIEAFLDLLNNGISTTAAAKQLGITKTSAYRFREQWMKTGEVVRRKPGPATETVSPLKQEHTTFIIKFIDEFATATIEHVRDALMNEFENLSIKIGKNPRKA
ncbi:hypothetical protein INT46_005153 [Mucor plumbeus]|uniref:Uncharacterized protein n=1 Tax=Mucor plumbeus TaxID=97098 RepID=A0A8H7URT9_9FUNG|nr:hypothetical protein INT46_005153 [Mucor plumbeus]